MGSNDSSSGLSLEKTAAEQEAELRAKKEEQELKALQSA